LKSAANNGANFYWGKDKRKSLAFVRRAFSFGGCPPVCEAHYLLGKNEGSDKFERHAQGDNFLILPGRVSGNESAQAGKERLGKSNRPRFH